MSEHVLTDTLFEQFELHPRLAQGLTDCGFVRCTPIQSLSLPVALTGRDVAGQAQTGTGKTCAFLVAMMQRLLTTPAQADRRDTDPRALIIAPTRELAIQIEKDALAIGGHTGLRMALIYGGVDYEKQRQQLKDGCDIIIATPGRLLDYYKQHIFALDSVDVMIIDEADRMFDLGFIKDVRYIFRRLPERDQRQVLLFSATLSHRVLELAYEHMNEAEKLVVETDNITADHVRQVVMFPAREEKLPLLLNLIATHEPERSIIFANTKACVERVTDSLKRHGHKVGALSGDVPQVKRQKLLQRFKDSQIDMLVATDVAARGLHIPHVSHVFNYDLPQDAEDYVHRIGRTARLGAEGDAISFACDKYAMGLPDIEEYIEQKIPVQSIDPKMLKMPRPPAPAAPRPPADEDASEPAHAGGQPAASQADAHHAGTPTSAPKKRRRTRGGRNRKQGDVPAGDNAQHGSAHPEPAKAAHDGDAPEATVGRDSSRASTGTVHGASEAADGAPRKRRRRRGGRNRGGQRKHAGEGAPDNQAHARQGRAGAADDKRASGTKDASAPSPRSNRSSGRTDASPPRDTRRAAGNGKSVEKPAQRREPPQSVRDNAAASPSRGQGGLLKRLGKALFGDR